MSLCADEELHFSQEVDKLTTSPKYYNLHKANGFFKLERYLERCRIKLTLDLVMNLEVFLEFFNNFRGEPWRRISSIANMGMIFITLPELSLLSNSTLFFNPRSLSGSPNLSVNSEIEGSLTNIKSIVETCVEVSSSRITVGFVPVYDYQVVEFSIFKQFMGYDISAFLDIRKNSFSGRGQRRRMLVFGSNCIDNIKLQVKPNCLLRCGPVVMASVTTSLVHLSMGDITGHKTVICSTVLRLNPRKLYLRAGELALAFHAFVVFLVECEVSTIGKLPLELDYYNVSSSLFKAALTRSFRIRKRLILKQRNSYEQNLSIESHVYSKFAKKLENI